jgi:peptidoglycan/LPS O-acetylase OafA/YrhL
VTLLAATAMQFAFQSRTGNFFIFDANDWQHFVKSIFLVQNWLPPDELQSFNGPAWAVSIEVLLYIIFFAAVRLGMRGPVGAIGVAIIGAIIFFWDGQIGRGIMGFFWGGATYYAVRRLVIHRRAKAIARAVIVAAIAAWLVCVVEIYLGPIQAVFQLTPFAKFFAAHAYPIFLQAYILVVVPLTLAALALHEQLFSGPYGRLKVLGDISYSTYLIHFPMQLALALLALQLGWMPADFMHGWVMLAFYAVLILLGWLSYMYLERPLQAFIRGRSRKRATVAVQSHS